MKNCIVDILGFSQRNPDHVRPANPATFRFSDGSLKGWFMKFTHLSILL